MLNLDENDSVPCCLALNVVGVYTVHCRSTSNSHCCYYCSVSMTCQSRQSGLNVHIYTSICSLCQSPWKAEIHAVRAWSPRDEGSVSVQSEVAVRRSENKTANEAIFQWIDQERQRNYVTGLITARTQSGSIIAQSFNKNYSAVLRSEQTNSGKISSRNFPNGPKILMYAG